MCDEPHACADGCARTHTNPVANYDFACNVHANARANGDFACNLRANARSHCDFACNLHASVCANFHSHAAACDTARAANHIASRKRVRPRRSRAGSRRFDLRL